MFEKFIKDLRSFVPFTDEEAAYFISLVEFRNLKRFDKLLRYGEVCNHISYLNKGLIRYCYEIDGKEHTTRVFKEGQWTSNYISFITRTSSDVFLEALEDTEIIQVHYDKLQKAYDHSKIFERLGRKVAEAQFIDILLWYRIEARKPPEVRYAEMEKRDPELLARIPLKYIASMLDIEPGSLSRIRKRVHHNIT